jgi:hypothetical protein
MRGSNKRLSRRVIKAEANQNKSKNTQEQTSPPNTPNLPASFAFFPKIYPCPICLAKAGQKKKYSAEWWKIRLEFAAIIGGLFAVVIYFFQMRANQGQVDAAYKQFGAMTNQLSEMQTAREQDERAWIAPYDFAKYGEPEGIYRVFFKNTGKTPALNVDSDVRSTGVINDVETANWPTNPPGPYSGVLAPEIQRHADTERISGVYFYGRIWYDDVFGKHHWTDFCVFFDPNSTGGFVITKFGNATDDSKTNNSH